MANSRNFRIDNANIELEVTDNDSVIVSNNRTNESYSYEKQSDGSHIDKAITHANNMIDERAVDMKSRVKEFFNNPDGTQI